MKGERMFDLLTDIDTDIIEEAAHFVPSKDAAPFMWKRWATAAACLAVILGALSFYAEAREYNAAVSFFREYELSSDGLTRGEQKRVYRDISTGRFSYDKTAQVIENSVGGYELFQEAPTSEDLDNLWNYRNSIRSFPRPNPNPDGASYSYEYFERYDSTLGIHVYDRTVFTKLMAGETQWSVEVRNMHIEGIVETGDAVIVYGKTPARLNAPGYGRVVMIGSDGTILWGKQMSNGFGDEYVGAVVCDDDKITVFSRGDLKYLCVTQLDKSGNTTAFTKNEVGNYGIGAAAKLGDSYIVKLWIHDQQNLLMRVNADGSLSDTFTYSSENAKTYISDMLEHNGSVYLSAYSVPKLGGGEGEAGRRSDIAPVLDQIDESQNYSISNEELTTLVRDNFTAVLLVLSAETGVPQTFFEVEGSLGAGLSTDQSGQLIWNVERITDTFFSMATSSFTIGGASTVYRYSFGGDGTIRQEKTGEVVSFRR